MSPTYRSSIRHRRSRVGSLASPSFLLFERVIGSSLKAAPNKASSYRYLLFCQNEIQALLSIEHVKAPVFSFIWRPGCIRLGGRFAPTTRAVCARRPRREPSASRPYVHARAAEYGSVSAGAGPGYQAFSAGVAAADQDRGFPRSGK
ncbi:hypothetical protein NL676_001857 [Syzygium grande]|nr:hypothetical protein NL676_001857 [Syzygium grande]